MKKPRTLLLIALFVGSPAFSSDLAGKVEYIELQPQAPKADKPIRDPWEGWKKDFASQVEKRTQARLKELHMPPEGSLNASIKVDARGDIEIEEIDDKSSNLGLVSENAVLRLEHSKMLTFPIGITDTVVVNDIVIETLPDNIIKVEFKAK